MNNAQFKMECFKNGLYSREQVIDFYNVVYEENTKFNKRDAQLWMNGKTSYKLVTKTNDSSRLFVRCKLNVPIRTEYWRYDWRNWWRSSSR